MEMYGIREVGDWLSAVCECVGRSPRLWVNGSTVCVRLCKTVCVWVVCVCVSYVCYKAWLQRGPDESADSPGVGFWASSELLEFYDTPNMHQAFSFLHRFLAKSSLFFSILPNFYFAPRSAAQLTHESRQPYAHPRHSEVCPCAPRPARTARPAHLALSAPCWPLQELGCISRHACADEE